jgi:hypothetical protein
MKTKYFLASLTIDLVVVGCEPTEIDQTDFDPNSGDTTQTGGISFKMNSNGQSWTYNSTGLGIFCDSVGIGLPFSIWGVATGDSVYYNPANDSLITGQNDTVFYLAWLSTIDTVGTYSLSNPAVFAIDCRFETSNYSQEYDASQLMVDISKVTTDSIYGTYSGPIEEVILQNMNYINTGVFDTVNASFVVYRVPC